MVAGSCLLAACVAVAAGQTAVKRITWADAAPLHARLEANDITAAAFPSHVERIGREHAQRVRDGDVDHLVFYWLQSTRFTSLPPIEPALSAKGLVDSLEPAERETFLQQSQAPPTRIPAPVTARLAALLRALDAPSKDPRLAYFRELVNATFAVRREREVALLNEYLRAMRFVYEKEFVAQRSPNRAEAVAELYRTRGLSTDTAVEAGYLVYLGLEVIKSLEPDRRIRRVLIVGPGLDIAPRTSLLEVGPPESYQPWAIMDALLALGLSRVDDLEVVGADINPRVVSHLRRAHAAPPVLTLVSEIRDSDTVTLSPEYRQYFARLGGAVGDEVKGGTAIDGDQGHLRKTVQVRATAARALRAETLDVVTERLDAPPFDLIVATNILPYFDGVELMLAVSNIGRMLAPGGVFLHNEGRPLLPDVAASLGFPFTQSRQVIIATVRGAPPLVDSVWLHRKAQ